MAVTTHRSWTYPDEFEDPHYVSFTTMVESIDDDVNTLFWKDSTTFASAYSSSDQAIDVAGAHTKVTLGLESADFGANFAGSAYTVPSSGLYYVQGSVAFSSALGAYGEIYKAGALAMQNRRTMSAAENIPVSCILNCTAGATIELYVYCDTTCNVVGNAYQTYMQVIRIGQ